jgi:phosphohistidine phosphatase SixA
MNLIGGFVILFAMLVSTSARSDSKASKSKSTKASSNTIVYLFRHAEQQRTTTTLGTATSAYDVLYNGDGVDISAIDGDTIGSNYDDACGSTHCAEELNPLGLMRASMLGQWFQDKGILSSTTDVFATSKRRTQQTVLPAAALAEMTVQTFPVDGTELDPQSARRTTCPTIDAIKNVSNGSQILVASHTSAIYQIMGPGVEEECTGFGIDISNDDIFPKDDRGSVPRAEYGFIWKFSIDAEGNAHFLKRIDFKLDLITG